MLAAQQKISEELNYESKTVCKAYVQGLQNHQKRRQSNVHLLER